MTAPRLSDHSPSLGLHGSVAAGFRELHEPNEPNELHEP